MAHTVTVYSKPNCVQCTATCRALDARHIPYAVVDLTEDAAALDHIKSLGYQQAPVVITAQDQWSGYRPDRIKAITVPQPA